MTIQLYTEWLNEAFNKRHGAMFNQSSLLLVDQARSQRREGKKTKNVTTVFIT